MRSLASLRILWNLNQPYISPQHTSNLTFCLFPCDFWLLNMVSAKQKRDIRERIHFYFEDIETPLGRAIDFFIIALVIIASVIFVFETYENHPFSRQTLELAATVIMSI